MVSASRNKYSMLSEMDSTVCVLACVCACVHVYGAATAMGFTWGCDQRKRVPWRQGRLECGNILLTRRCGGFDFSFGLFDRLINLTLKNFAFVLAKSFLLHLFHFVHRVTADVAQRHLALLTKSLGCLGELFPALGRECCQYIQE